MPHAMLELESVEACREGRVVLANVRLSIAAGEHVAITGPNGAGKSTLLQVLAGLLIPSSGVARIAGRNPADLDVRRRASLLPQDAPLLTRTVRRDVELPLKLRAVAASERRSRAEAALVRAGAAHLADRASGMLSGGEARRVALARALVADPEVLLLDEPFAAIDGKSRIELLDGLLSHARSRGTTLVLVTQDDSEAMRAASRIIAMRDGRLV